MTDLNDVLGKGNKQLGDENCENWGSYMRMKVRKLDKQFEHIQDDSDGGLSNLFNGVVIFVNGYTVPSSDELKKLMKKHGGGFQQYYSRTKCTHIVATNLPDSKIKELKNEKVVHPNWILDSIKENKVLPYRQYLLYGRGGVRLTIGNTTTKIETEDNAMCGTELASCSNSSALVHAETIVGDHDGEQDIDIATKTLQQSNCEKTGLKPTGDIQQRSTSVPKAGDPNFVSEYYSHSRLHYLSTWGAEFKDFINNLISNTEVKAKSQVTKIKSKERLIMHIDMDSFFVSVTLRNRPELKGKPVAVCHAGRGPGTRRTSGPDASFSTAEIASCSYEARACGVANGMWLGDARKLCPSIVSVPYQFDQYREVSQQLYTILASYTHDIQAVSCDEAFVDLTTCGLEEHTSPLQLVQRIRDEIFNKTKCPASAGIGSNILLARMSTKVAKPNGQFHLQPDNVQEFIAKQKVSDLPGVGYSLRQKLDSLNVVTCHDLQLIQLHMLRRQFGRKTGEMLYKYCRGQDDRQLQVERERKSVSAEINYAIRFQEESEPEKFITDLSHEVHRRLKTAGVKGKHLTFKLKIRQKDAPIIPTKFMGCGRCDSHSRSVTMATFTDDASTIAKHCTAMLKSLGAPVSDIRGMGIQMSKLSKNVTSSSSSSTATKTIHDFMKPPAKNPRRNILGSLSSSREIASNGFRPVTEAHDHVPEGTECFTGDNDITTKVLTTHDDQNEDFCLALSDDELPDEPAVNITKRDTTQNNAPAYVTGQQPSAYLPTRSAITGTNSNTMPPLPVFSPRNKNDSPCSKNSSLRRTNQRSPESTNHRSPRSTNQLRSPRSTNQRSPKSANQRTQRNLLSSLQSPKSRCIGGSAFSLPSQIDATVFEALPDEIKADIAQSYKQKNQHLPLRTATTSSTGIIINTVAESENGEEYGKLPFEASQIDPEVFEALPEEIKRDIEQSYNEKRNEKLVLRSNDHATDLNLRTSQIDPEVFEALPEEIRRDIEQSLLRQGTNQNEFGLRNNNDVHSKKRTINAKDNSVLSDASIFETLSEEIGKDAKVSRRNYNEVSKKKSKGRGHERKALKESKGAAKKRTIKSYTETVSKPSNQPSDISSHVDASFLQAIPECLRHEVQLAYEQQRRHDEKGEQHKQQLAENTNLYNGASTSVVKEMTSSAYNLGTSLATPVKQKVSLAGAETLPNIRNMLKCWVNTTEEPLDEDIGILVSFLESLIYEKDLEKLWVVLKFFRRLVCDVKSWQLSFNTVLRSVQNILQNTYSGRLSVEYFND